MRTATLSGSCIERRQILGLLAYLPFATTAIAQVPKRIAAIDWAMLETLMALGLDPIAATELIQFRNKAVEPSVPSSTVDLGLRGSPNFELLYLLKPDLILSSPFYARQQEKLESIAPVVSLQFYERGQPPYRKALNALSSLGDILNRRAEAEAVLAAQEGTLAGIRNDVARVSSRPLYLVNIGDARHFRAFGADSMFGDILNRVGLTNAWTDRSRYTFAAPVPIEAMAATPEARIVVISDIPVEARSSLQTSMIWNSLTPVREGRVHVLANINPYGGITAGLRFARLLQAALKDVTD